MNTPFGRHDRDLGRVGVLERDVGVSVETLAMSVCFRLTTPALPENRCSGCPSKGRRAIRSVIARSASTCERAETQAGDFGGYRTC
ncbi:hypothetical protein [Sinorhizobium meliloti]|uniref:hypothetical protein n=1 Tax=Rhizobium meliloti TaxID=382 RepID=UPI0013E2F1BE